jgi:hypothetical protein
MNSTLGGDYFGEGDSLLVNALFSALMLTGRIPGGNRAEAVSVREWFCGLLARAPLSRIFVLRRLGWEKPLIDLTKLP